MTPSKPKPWLTRSRSEWTEKMTDNVSLPTSKQPFRLAICREANSLSTVLPATSPRYAKLPTGTRVEISVESWKISRRIGEIIRGGAGGAGLMIDYGGDRHYGSSFRVSRRSVLRIKRNTTLWGRRGRDMLITGIPEPQNRGCIRRTWISRLDGQCRLWLSQRIPD